MKYGMSFIDNGSVLERYLWGGRIIVASNLTNYLTVF